MPNKRYQELQLSSQKKLETSAEQIRNLIPTSGEIGTLIEDMFRSYLVEVLPEKIGVSNGFVMDSEGGESQQMDIILYDKMTKLWTIFHRFSCDRFHTDAAPTGLWTLGGTTSIQMPPLRGCSSWKPMRCFFYELGSPENS